MSNYNKAFNVLLDRFLNDLVKSYPEEHKFRDLVRAANTLVKFNFKKPLYLFRKKVILLFRENIVNRDETFFMENDYSEMANNSKNKEDAFQLIDRLKEYWGSMSDNNKKIIWDYLNKLIILSDKIG